MKLRIRGNSIRLRLRKGELHRLTTEGQVEESIAFGPEPADRLVYSIRSENRFDVFASFQNGHIDIAVPIETINSWASSDQVGIEHSQPIGLQSLNILIEKDFECIDGPPDESNDDAFPNPLRADGCGPKASIGSMP